MSRGEKEQHAISRLRQSLDDCSIYYGLTGGDVKEFRQCVMSCTPNEEPSSFPDFVFSNGVLEHFQITSSSENENGSTQSINEGAFNKTFRLELDKQTIDVEPGKVVFYGDCMRNPVHSHDFLLRSLDRNWMKHYRSFESYEGRRDIGIFLIEYRDFGLTMAEARYRGFEERLQGDLPLAEIQNDYRLSRDKHALGYLKRFSNIKYIAFLSSFVEVFLVSALGQYVKLLPYEYVIADNNAMLVKRAVSFSSAEVTNE